MLGMYALERETDTFVCEKKSVLSFVIDRSTFSRSLYYGTLVPRIRITMIFV
jgi:hypothetical protein